MYLASELMQTYHDTAKPQCNVSRACKIVQMHKILNLLTKKGQSEELERIAKIKNCKFRSIKKLRLDLLENLELSLENNTEMGFKVKNLKKLITELKKAKNEHISIHFVGNEEDNFFIYTDNKIDILYGIIE
jgi:hypothetical protein